MGVTASLVRFATARPHLLVVESAGGAGVRLQVEMLAREQGWAVVETPADADLLVVCGVATELAEHVRRVWDQLPGPRAQVLLTGADDVRAALLAGRTVLGDPAVQRADVRRTERPEPGPTAMGGMDHDMGGHDTGGHDTGGHDTGGMPTPEDDPHAGHDMGGMPMPEDDPHAGHDMGGMPTPEDDPHAGHDMGGMPTPEEGPHAGHDMGGMAMPEDDPHAGHDMGGMDMGGMSGHEGHDMGGMEMPAGLGMADRAPDRDGLKLDVLTVPWGPVLPWWPAGLVLTTVLQGDVVQSATVERLGSDQRVGWAAALAHLDPPVAAAVVRLDALVRLLGVAGWDSARLRCQRVRDALLNGEPAAPDLPRFVRRVSGSRALARMTTGIATSGGEDVRERYRRWLAEAVAAVEDGVLPPSAEEPHVLHQLPDLVTGTEVAGMRLVVASLDLALSGADGRAAAHV